MERLIHLLSLPPSEEVWTDICAELDAENTPDLTREKIAFCEERMQHWPDHLREASVLWILLDEPEKIRLGRVIPFAAYIRLVRILESHLSSEILAKQVHGHESVANMCFDSPTQKLWALSSLSPYLGKASPLYGQRFLYEIDWTHEKGRLLKVFKAELDWWEMQSEFLYHCRNGLTISAANYKENPKAGNTTLTVMDGTETRFQYTCPGTSKDEWYAHRSYNEKEIFRITEDEQFLYWCTMDAKIIRIDLLDFSLKTITTPSYPMADMEIVGEILVLFLRNKNFYYLDKELNEIPPLNVGLGREGDHSLLTFGAINAVLIERNNNEYSPSKAIGSFAYWEFSSIHLEWELRVYQHIFYERKLEVEPDFFFRKVRVGSQWRVAYLAPYPDTTLHVVDFPSMQQAELIIEGNRMNLHFCFAAQGEEIIFFTGTFWRTWRFQMR